MTDPTIINSFRKDADRSDLVQLLVDHVRQEEKYHEIVEKNDKLLQELSKEVKDHLEESRIVIETAHRLSIVLDFLCFIRNNIVVFFIVFLIGYAILTGHWKDHFDELFHKFVSP